MEALFLQICHGLLGVNNFGVIFVNTGLTAVHTISITPTDMIGPQYRCTPLVSACTLQKRVLLIYQ